MVLYCMPNDALNSNMDMLISLVLTIWSSKHYSVIRTQPVHWSHKVDFSQVSLLPSLFKEVNSLILQGVSRQRNFTHKHTHTHTHIHTHTHRYINTLMHYTFLSSITELRMQGYFGTNITYLTVNIFDGSMSKSLEK